LNNISHLSSFTRQASTVSLQEEQLAVKRLKAMLMNRLTWLVLFSYTLLLFKPVMPVFMDVLAHTFWEQQHLLTVHEVNGKFHVHNELVNSHQSDKDKQANSKSEVNEYLPVTVSKLFVYRAHFYIKTMYNFYSCFYPFSSLDKDNPPPEA